MDVAEVILPPRLNIGVYQPFFKQLCEWLNSMTYNIIIIINYTRVVREQLR